MSNSIRLVEVGPRDGLQNQAREIPTEVKVGWIERLTEAGYEEIEASSFVHPKWVPQLADAREVFAAIGPSAGAKPANSEPKRDDSQSLAHSTLRPTVYSALVPNAKGLEAALAAGVTRIALFTAASETFNQKNINATISESLDRFREIFDRIAGLDLRVRGYVSTCFGCPYEGAVDPAQVVRISHDLLELGCQEVVISDTIGVATPREVTQVLEPLAESIPVDQTALHFHDTRGMAVANVLRALDHDIRAFDGAAGGLGGCPYAPGATGNVATEDLLYLLHGLGLETGVSLDHVIAADLWFEKATQIELPSRVLATAR